MEIKTRIFNQSHIKYIVIVLMVLDHFAQYFLTPNSPAFLFIALLHIFGIFLVPIFIELFYNGLPEKKLPLTNGFSIFFIRDIY